MIIYKKYFWPAVTAVLAFLFVSQAPLLFAAQRSAQVHAGIRSMDRAMASAMQDMDRQMRQRQDINDVMRHRDDY